MQKGQFFITTKLVESGESLKKHDSTGNNTTMPSDAN
jgi:hypothetical protein